MTAWPDGIGGGMSKKAACISRMEKILAELGALKPAYAGLSTSQDQVLAHFMDRADEIVTASLLAKDLPVPLHILSRVLCEDLFLVASVAQSADAAEEYEAGVEGEMARLMLAHLKAGWGVIRNIRTKEPATAEFMKRSSALKSRASKFAARTSQSWRKGRAPEGL